MAFQKGGPGARKIGGHFFVFQILNIYRILKYIEKHFHKGKKHKHLLIYNRWLL